VKDWHEHIEDYMNGTLEGDLLIAFEKEMESNATLRAAIENYEDAKLISEGLLEVDMMETLEELGMSNDGKGKGISNDEFRMSNDGKGIENEDGGISNENNRDELQVSETKLDSVIEGLGNRSSENIDRSVEMKDHPTKLAIEKKVKRFNLRRLAIAASIIGIIAFCTCWMMDYSANQEYIAYVQNSYIKPEDEDATKSGAEDNIDGTPFEKGKKYFGLNEFKESEKWFLMALETEKDKKIRSEGHYWLGCAYIMLGDVEKAMRAWAESADERAKKSIVIAQNGKKK
jgi:tetratricopeptide (TPR) repeat protein